MNPIKVNQMTNRFLNLKAEKEVEFLGEKVKIRKLSVRHVLEIQQKTKELQAIEKPTEEDQLRMIYEIVKRGVPEFIEVKLEEIFELSLDDLNTLSNQIMEYSGVGNSNSPQKN